MFSWCLQGFELLVIPDNILIRQLLASFTGQPPTQPCDHAIKTLLLLFERYRALNFQRIYTSILQIGYEDITFLLYHSAFPRTNILSSCI